MRRIVRDLPRLPHVRGLLRHVPGRLRARRPRHREARRRGRRELLDDDDFASATELCWQCKLCYIKCPYTPDEEHEWLLDVPRLLTREKAQRARRNGDHAAGPGARRAAAPRADDGRAAGAHRELRERQPPRAQGDAGGRRHLGGVSRSRRSARRASRAGSRSTSRCPSAGSRGTVAALRDLPRRLQLPAHRGLRRPRARAERLGVVRPEQTCCGMPNLDGGDIDAARAKARANVASLLAQVERGARSSSLQPTCGYTIRKEWPELLGTAEARARRRGDARPDGAARAAAARQDAGARLHDGLGQGRLPRGLPPARAEDRLPRRRACSARSRHRGRGRRAVLRGRRHLGHEGAALRDGPALRAEARARNRERRTPPRS